MKSLRGTLLLLLCWCGCVAPQAHAWTLTQVKHIAAGCTASPCVVTLASTGANHLLVVGLTSNSATAALGAPPAAACAVSWVHGPNAPNTAAGNADDAYYCLQSNSGITSFSQPVTGTLNTTDICVWEAALSLTAMALDTGAVPAQQASDATCTACAGVPLTLSGNADFIVVMSSGGGGVSNLTGTGFTLDFTTSFGDGFGHGLTTGSLTAPATWTASSGTQAPYAIAFQELPATLHNFTVSPIVP